jgi:hypothetical protein
VLFTFGFDRMVFPAATVIMVTFWVSFLVLYVAKVRRSRSALEFEHHAQLEEQRKVERFKAAVKPGKGATSVI